ncbi:MAG: hypothetical protein ACR2G1_04585, partial [Rubrobacteraceae bacterium]
TYMNALTSTTPQPVKTPMIMPDDRSAIAAAITMCAGIGTQGVRLVRIENTLKLRRMWVSEALLSEVESDERLAVVEEARLIDFGEDGSLL